MNTYRIISSRIGEVGAEFIPDETVNIDALLAGGFISIDGRQAPKKSDKTESPTSKE